MPVRTAPPRPALLYIFRLAPVHSFFYPCSFYPVNKPPALFTKTQPPAGTRLRLRDTGPDRCCTCARQQL